MVHELLDFTPAEYDAVAAVRSTCRPEFALPADAMEARDRARPSEKPVQRVVARVEGEVVAYAEIGQDPFHDDPTQYVMNVYVDPRRQGQGIGGALFEELERRAARLDVSALQGGHHEDHPYAATFAARRGFRPGMRHVFSRVEITPALLANAPAPPEGVRLTSLAELRAELGEDEAIARLFPLVQDFTADIPGGEGAARGMRPENLARNLLDPLIIPEVYCVAAHGDELVGKSDLRKTPDPRGLWTGSTGVRRAWRRRGLALTLKRAAFAWAAARGYAHVTTANAEENHGMLRLNQRLGFEPLVTYCEQVR